MEVAEKARRELARRRLPDYCAYVMPEFILGRPQKELIDALEQVERGAIKRLIVSMPPRHGKSLLASQLFPTWMLGRHDRAEIVQATYAHPLSLTHSRLARKVFLSPEYREVFPEAQYEASRESQERVAELRQAADEWGTASGGHYYAVGIGGGLTGRGADVALIDDPVKNREEANSPTMRERAWDWYKSTLYTRLSPEGAIILIMTRWHPDDMAGRIAKQVAEGDSEPWHTISLPAIDEHNNALWPERWSHERLEKTRRAIGQFEWGSLYQQQPVLRGGNMFRADRIQTHEDDSLFPTHGYARVWDLASTEKERAGDDPDFTAGALVALTEDAEGLTHLWLRDMISGQWGPSYRDRRIVETARADGETVKIGIEAVGGYKDSVATIQEKILASGSQLRVESLSGRDLAGDKVARATPVEAIIEDGRFHILQAPWNAQFMEQAYGFPDCPHDDEIDAVALAYHLRKRSHKRVRIMRDGRMMQ